MSIVLIGLGGLMVMFGVTVGLAAQQMRNEGEVVHDSVFLFFGAIVGIGGFLMLRVAELI